MDYKTIRPLLDKYLEGTTSLAEEKQLRDYFSKATELPEAFQPYQTLFKQFDALAQETYTPQSKPKSQWYTWAGVAAVIVLGLCFYFYPMAKPQPVYAYVNGEPVASKAAAIEETQKALLLVSKRLGQGTTELNRIQQFHKVEQLIKGTK